MSAGRDQLRQTFNQAAGLYERARPRYPGELVQDLARLARIGPGSRVLEIGPGTGQLTVPLAALGCAVTAVELGPDMAAAARRALAGFPAARVVVAAFEDWPLPAEPFDAVVSATAFHWIDPDIRLAKSAAALRPGGTLSIVHTHHVAGGTRGFFVDAQACYERWERETPPGGLRLPEVADVIAGAAAGDPAGGGLFMPAESRYHEADVAYSAAAFLDTVRTYSNIMAMDGEAREGLLRCLASIIGSRYGGQIIKHYLFSVSVARRLPR